MASGEGGTDFCMKSATSRNARRVVGHCGEFYGVEVAIEVGEDCKGSLKPIPSCFWSFKYWEREEETQ